MPPRRNVRKFNPKRKVVQRPANKPKKFNKKPMRMSRSLTIPFPEVRQCTFLYKQPSVTINSATVGKILTRFACNGMYDFDLDNYLGNKQPMFYDQMFGALGPYRYYRVNAWRTKITYTNTSNNAQHVYFDPGAIGSVVEADTAVEVQNRPGAIYRLVTGAGNAKPQTTFTSYKTTTSFAPRNTSSGLEYGASYNSNPANTINSTLLVTNLDDTDLTVFTGVVCIEHIFYATCYLQDSTLS